MSHNYDDDRNDDGCSQEPVIPCGFLKLDEIKGETQIRWLWADKVPLGHVTILVGEASSGKSLLAAEIAARVSSGAGWPVAAGQKPGKEEPAGSVLIAHSNQHENLVLKGRLLAAGADPWRVSVINRDAFEFERDIGAVDPGDDPPEPVEASLMALEGALVQIRDAKLVVVDHLLGWLGRARLRPDELTEVFNRLAPMAARYRVALVVLWRLEKGGRAAQTRMLDALAGEASVIWLLANDTYSSHTRSAVCAQNRLGAPSDDLAFRIEGHRLVWQEAVRQVSADDLLAAHTADRHERRQAGQWLLDILSQGPLEAKQLWQEARECGLAERTLRRAAAELGLRPTKDGKRNVWLWGLRCGNGSGSFQPPVENVAALPEVGSLADAAVVRMELRRDAFPSVAAFPPVGSLASTSGAGGEVSASDQNVAALLAVGSLADANATAPGVSTGEASVLDPACSREQSDEAEQKLLGEAIANAAAKEGGGDQAQPSASASVSERRLRRERRALERTMRICRDG